MPEPKAHRDNKKTKKENTTQKDISEKRGKSMYPFALRIKFCPQIIYTVQPYFKVQKAINKGKKVAQIGRLLIFQETPVVHRKTTLTNGT